MMRLTMTDISQLEVYTDGQCPLCRWTRARVEPLDTAHRLAWFDYHDPAALKRAAPHTPQELAAEMHVRRQKDGAWRKGYWAWLEVLGVLPHWRWLVPVLAAWPLRALGPGFYRFIAGRRYTLFGVPPPCDESGICQLHTNQK
jgi:predicted DCC family thiol-disulfide oxidoreductase YuxK